MCVIGVTGEFGSGKSTVAGFFGRLGAHVIDADAIVRDILQNDVSCRRALRRIFGEQVFTEGILDRKKLAAKVFTDRGALRSLEKLLHPLARKQVEKILKGSTTISYVLDAPLLIEAGWQDLVDVLVVVRANHALQVSRIRQRMGLSRIEVMRRIKRQLPVRTKLAHADLVVDNRGSLADTDKQVRAIWQGLSQKRKIKKGEL